MIFVCDQRILIRYAYSFQTRQSPVYCKTGAMPFPSVDLTCTQSIDIHVIIRQKCHILPFMSIYIRKRALEAPYIEFEHLGDDKVTRLRLFRISLEFDRPEKPFNDLGKEPQKSNG